VWVIFVFETEDLETHQTRFSSRCDADCASFVVETRAYSDLVSSSHFCVLLFAGFDFTLAWRDGGATCAAKSWVLI
jgi:hypothetical protein